MCKNSQIRAWATHVLWIVLIFLRSESTWSQTQSTSDDSQSRVEALHQEAPTTSPSSTDSSESTPTIVTNIPTIEEADSGPPALKLQLTTEARNLQTDLAERKQLEGVSLFEVSANGSYAVDRHLSLLFDLAAERMGDQSLFFPRVAAVRLSPWSSVQLDVGQFFIPIGYFVERDQWFSSLPHYYNRLLYWARGTDTGARLSIMPFNGSKLLSLEGSMFSGRSTRPGDDRPGPATRAPQLFSLRSQSSYHDVFIQQWEHEVAFRNRVQAYGGGVSLFYQFQDYPIRPEIYFEAYSMRESQADGPAEFTVAGTAVAQLRAYYFNVGVMAARSQSRIRSQQMNQPLAPINETTLFADAYLHRFFRLRVEQREVIQQQALVSDTVIRAIAEIQAF
jgi:hypothetical protein